MYEFARLETVHQNHQRECGEQTLVLQAHGVMLSYRINYKFGLLWESKWGLWFVFRYQYYGENFTPSVSARYATHKEQAPSLSQGQKRGLSNTGIWGRLYGNRKVAKTWTNWRPCSRPLNLYFVFSRSFSTGEIFAPFQDNILESFKPFDRAKLGWNFT